MEIFTSREIFKPKVGDILSYIDKRIHFNNIMVCYSIWEHYRAYIIYNSYACCELQHRIENQCQ